MFCPQCGVALKDGARFCNRCGAPIRTRAPGQDGPQPAADAVQTDVALTVDDILREVREQRQQSAVAVAPVSAQPEKPAPPAGARSRVAVRAVLWPLIVLLLAAAEVYLGFFAALPVGGTLFRYAVMTCALVLAAALFWIVGIASGRASNEI